MAIDTLAALANNYGWDLLGSAGFLEPGVMIALAAVDLGIMAVSGTQQLMKRMKKHPYSPEKKLRRVIQTGKKRFTKDWERSPKKKRLGNLTAHLIRSANDYEPRARLQHPAGSIFWNGSRKWTTSGHKGIRTSRWSKH